MPSTAPHSFLKRLLLTLIGLVAAGGTLSLSMPIGSSSTEFSQRCVTVMSPHSRCTLTSPGPPSGGGHGEHEKPKITPQLVVGVPAQIRRSGPATVYGAPSKQAGVKYVLDPGHEVKIICQQWAELVRSPRDGRPSALWDKLGDDEWVSDAFVDTNSDGPVTRFCHRHRP
ncbi:hypothetical protein [Streptomyces sp. NPDC056723]|uniref:hypothetical protein n=1 Tax=Streptomyces sp. NPDC056723 TaxID=3345925 RepID=UPI0036A809FC